MEEQDLEVICGQKWKGYRLLNYLTLDGHEFYSAILDPQDKTFCLFDTPRVDDTAVLLAALERGPKYE